MGNSTGTLKPVKPNKPSKDFPLFPHATGRWAKKVRQIALLRPLGFAGRCPELWLLQKDDLLAGRKPGGCRGFTIRDLANHVLTFKQHQRDLGEITARTFNDYKRTCELLVSTSSRNREVADLQADDFTVLRTELSKSRGPTSLHNEIGRIRVVFNFAYQNHHIPEPIRYGAGFKRPRKRTLRLARAEQSPKLFEAGEIRKMIGSADTQLKCMILLGINGGLGNADVGNLELPHCDLNAGWINYPRPKSGIDRRIPLWPETVQAIRDSVECRTSLKAREDADVVNDLPLAQ